MHEDTTRTAPRELPVVPLNSGGPIPTEWLQRTNRFARPIESSRRTGVTVRVDDRSIWCACTECGAPLSIRSWLRVADCWRCGASLELARCPQRRVAPEPEPEAAEAETAAPVLTPTPAEVLDLDATLRGLHRLIAPPLPNAQLAPPVLANQFAWAAWLSNMPAWLCSLLLHLIFLTLLALFALQPEPPRLGIVLSTTIGPAHRSGGAIRASKSDDMPEFDLPVPELDTPLDAEQHDELVMADRDAREIRIDPVATAPHLPNLEALRRSLDRDHPQPTFSVRDPRVRVELVRREGGTTWTEAAVARGLRWLAQHQMADGSWSLQRFPEAGSCRYRCGGESGMASDSAATSLALLPFLGAGQTHRTGIYRPVVQRGLSWLIEQQQVDGDLRGDSHEQAAMYAHGQAAIVLSEAYAMTRDSRLRDAAQRAVDFIVAAQHEGGGWRYAPGERGDTSVLGWQLMALHSAREAGLRVPAATFSGVHHFLDDVMTRDSVRYRYQPHFAPSCVMTAEALLCRMYAGWELDDPRLQAGLEWLVDEHPPREDEFDIYYWYYATQTLHHAGGPLWDRWNHAVREMLVTQQLRYGHQAGSWDPQGPHAHAGGRIYMTALAVCTLEVYYRHAPIFRPLNSRNAK